MENGTLIAHLDIMKVGKSSILLALIDKLRWNGIPSTLLKPSVDTRNGTEVVWSRCGLQATANTVSSTDSVIEIVEKLGNKKVFVDEVQFFTEVQIDELRILANMGYEVRCFGLLKDYCNKLFPASKRLIELMDSFNQIRELSPSYCTCGRPSIHNILMRDGKIVTTRAEGEIVLGDSEYKTICDHCYRQLLAEQEAMNG